MTSERCRGVPGVLGGGCTGIFVGGVRFAALVHDQDITDCCLSSIRPPRFSSNTLLATIRSPAGRSSFTTDPSRDPTYQVHRRAIAIIRASATHRQPPDFSLIILLSAPTQNEQVFCCFCFKERAPATSKVSLVKGSSPKHIFSIHA